MSTYQEDPVVQFLLNMLPPRLLAGYRTVAKLKYPIPDKHTLVGQLDRLISADTGLDKADKPSIDLIRMSLEPVDFPIETPQSGLEKFHARLTVQLGPVEISDRDSVDRPGICDIYQNTFGTICGQEACNAYQEALRGGLSEPQALVAGHLAGKECQQNFITVLLNRIRHAHELRPRPWLRF